ncbi:MAG TPA: GNAT family N-acetyltransferase [Thermodesulfovibrionales bacterium]|nr:GNAT family N-acetyltransferase [Thermodesulfovibrionales bacterium]
MVCPKDRVLLWPGMITYRRISTTDSEYILEKDLRFRVLRQPLGLVLSEEDICDEENQVHVVAVDDRGNVVGCVVVAFHDKKARIRQLAVEAPLRGQGIGKELIRHAEEAAQEREVREIMLHARVTSQGFFDRLGYTAASGVFEEVTIPHIEMKKSLITVNHSA